MKSSNVSGGVFIVSRSFLMPLFEGERSEGGKRLGEGKGGDIFFHWSFYDPKKEICKINFCENKLKLDNKDNSKNDVNENRRNYLA